MEHVVILGTGCAGSTAAIYTARASLKPIVFEGTEPGGQLTLTTEVENFPGFENGIQGPELVEIMKKQAQRFGADYRVGRCTNITKIDGGFNVEIDNGKSNIETQTVIVATGARARWLGLESEEKFKGRGVSTCATCDAFFYKDKPEVIIVGGGDSACEEAMVLAKFAKHVTVVVRRDVMRASKIMQDRVMKAENIDVMWDSQVTEVLGDNLVTGAKIKNSKTGEEFVHECSGIFLAIGHVPNTDFLEHLCEVDEHGYLKANARMQTSVPGIFAAGDVQDTIYRQAITAAGSGCAAALEAERFIEGLEQK